jgi:hypothetical protein
LGRPYSCSQFDSEKFPENPAEDPSLSRDYEPQKGQWYEDLDREDSFRVLDVDPDDATVRIQWLDGETQDLDVDQWHELDLELATEPEGWVDETAEDDEDEDDWDEEEDEEEDDWDDDDEDEDEDYDDDDDEYRDRE